MQPLAEQVGVHPIHLGVVVVMTLAMGLVTPPYGLCLLLACGIAGVPGLRVMPIMLILIGSIVAVILLAAPFPGIVLTVPRLLVPGWMQPPSAAAATHEGERMTTPSALDTPAVTVDLDVMEANIRRVQAHLARHGVANRPHVKTHKIPEIGRTQMAAGAVGITCQKLGEVEVFADAGVADDVLLTFNVLGREKTERLMALSRRLRRLAVVLDNEVVARGLSEAARAHGRDVPFLIECDTGFGRNGVQTPEAALELARTALRLGGLAFEGLMTFPNREPGTRVFLERALELFTHAGLPVPVVSGGGTPAIFSVHQFPMLTEHRAGTCVYNDVMVVASGTATWDDCAMRVRATVVSRPTDTRAVIDAGTKVLTSDQYGMKGYGHVMEYPEAVVSALSEEHGTVDLTTCPERPRVGDVVHVVPNHCCVVSNMVDEVYGVRGGSLEVTWPVAARGRVR